MILADTSVWIDHFRQTNQRLQSMLHEKLVLCHPFVIGELACGRLRNRSEILRLLQALPQAGPADQQEVLHLLETRELQGRGLGWTDVHLLASALLTGCTVWTLDRALARTASALHLAAL